MITTAASDMISDVWKLIFHLLGTRNCGRFLLVDKHMGALARVLVSHFFIVDTMGDGVGESSITYHTQRASVDDVYLASCINAFKGITWLDMTSHMANANAVAHMANTDVFTMAPSLRYLQHLSCS